MKFSETLTKVEGLANSDDSYVLTKFQGHGCFLIFPAILLVGVFRNKTKLNDIIFSTHVIP